MGRFFFAGVVGVVVFLVPIFVFVRIVVRHVSFAFRDRRSRLCTVAGQRLNNSVITYFPGKTEAETNIRAIIGRWAQVPGNS